MDGKEFLIVRFGYEWEQADGITYAICREASIVGRGETRPQAIKDLRAGLRVYLDDLRVRGELEAVLAEGKFPSSTLSLDRDIPHLTTDRWQKAKSGTTTDFVIGEREAVLV